MKPSSGAAIQYLQAREWNAGCGGRENQGQCRDCLGCSPAWLGGYHAPVIESCGHKPDCPLAAAIRDLGGSPLFKIREPTSDEKWATLSPQEQADWTDIGNRMREGLVKACADFIGKSQCSGCGKDREGDEPESIRDGWIIESNKATCPQCAMIEAATKPYSTDLFPS
jgi:hypothetical protein